MLFNSIDFAVFLPIVYALYWFLNRKEVWLQNLLIVLSSYVFYGWWDWRFLSLILLSTLVDYYVGLRLQKTNEEKVRRLLLALSVGTNLGLLGFFKYFNFFLDNFASAFSIFGQDIGISSLNIILPVGISFYTFQTLSYTIDIYRRRLEPTRDFIAFSAYVSFFPQLVAGPIERAHNLLPQFFVKRKFDYSHSVTGLRQILWGLFMKVVIADNCAVFANQIFANSDSYAGSTLLIGALFFSFQIYGDFSGYSNIAIGTARLFGFKLMQNFAFPYFSRNIAEFWRRWHISLSTWFRDYVYIPLGGSRTGRLMSARNVFIIFVVSGFWHGANWTFIIWGALNALYFMPLFILNKNRLYLDTVAHNSLFPSIRELISMAGTFLITVFAWIFFRAENMTHAVSYISEIVSPSLFTVPVLTGGGMEALIILLVLFAFAMEWIEREKEFALQSIGLTWPATPRRMLYFAIACTIFLLGVKEQTFIYFQF
jgi:alginate O-acetyltransferase complex protein AlgI